MNDTHASPSNENRATAGKLVPAARTLPATRDPYGPLGGYTGGAGEAPVGGGFDLLEYWRILYKRRWLILTIIGMFVALGAVRTLMMTPLYTSTVRLQIDRSVAKVVAAETYLRSTGAMPSFCVHNMPCCRAGPWRSVLLLR